MRRIILATVAALLLPAAAHAQSARPSPLMSTIRSATPAQKEQMLTCMQAALPKCVQTACPPGPVNQVMQCLQPYGACRAQIKHTCVQTVMSAAPPPAKR